LGGHLSKDARNNAVIGNNTHLYNSDNCIVNVPNDKLVVLDGLDGYIVVESDHMLMVLKAENEQELKNFLKDAESKSPQYFQK
jgi:mannose-1-phosphate guanylyltransferase